MPFVLLQINVIIMPLVLLQMDVIMMPLVLIQMNVTIMPSDERNPDTQLSTQQLLAFCLDFQAKDRRYQCCQHHIWLCSRSFFGSRQFSTLFDHRSVYLYGIGHSQLCTREFVLTLFWTKPVRNDTIDRSELKLGWETGGSGSTLKWTKRHGLFVCGVRQMCHGNRCGFFLGFVYASLTRVPSVKANLATD